MIRSLSFQEPVRAGGQFVLRDLRGAVSRTVSSTGTVTSTAVFDALGVQRSGTGALASGVIRDTYGNANEDGMTAFLAGRSLASPSLGDWTLPKLVSAGHCIWGLLSAPLGDCIDKIDAACKKCLLAAVFMCIITKGIGCAKGIANCRRACGDDVGNCVSVIRGWLRKSETRIAIANRVATAVAE